ncbi:hypothetical protein M422DRAFT_98294, partial [Sphaerobolus stellatus SS14]
LVNKLSDSELIIEVMAGAPEYWAAILDTERYMNTVEFQSAIKYHESSLTNPPFGTTSTTGLEDPRNTSSPGGSFKRQNFVRSHKIGSSPETSCPAFPKDDVNVSKKATPKSKGAHPCRHCGSGKHWDYECKYSSAKSKTACTRAVESSFDKGEAQCEYDELY